MIQSILVPVDFSACSAAALRYAEAFAAATDAASVKVIHVFTPQVASSNTMVIPPMGELMDQRDETFRQFLQDTPATPGVARTADLVLGFAADKIVDLSAENDLVIMGCTGKDDFLEEVFGSVSSTVSEKAHCPVMLIPARATFQPYENILYASNSLSLSREAVLKFRGFNKLFHARVHFVHINDDEGAHEGRRERLFAPLFNKPEPEFAFQIEEVNADSVQRGIMNYLELRQIALAVMVTKHRGFWGRLFHHENLPQTVLHPTTPLLVLHLEE